MEYQHKEKKSRNIVLHDCRCNQMVYENNTLTFVLKDGFYLGIKHKKNQTGEAVKTGSAEIQYKILNDALEGFNVFTVTDKNGKHADRKLWNQAKFIAKVNEGKFEIEFTDILKNDNGREIVLVGYVWSKKKPFSKECFIYIESNAAMCYWNDPE